MDGLRTLLVPVDFSRASMAAFEAALRLARGGTAIVVLHVLDEALLSFVTELGYALPAEVAAKARTHASARMQRLTSVALPPGVELERVIVEGHPVRKIVELAAELAADLVVLGLPPGPGAAVAETVLRTCACPVLAIPGEAGEAVVPEDVSPSDGASSGAPSTL